MQAVRNTKAVKTAKDICLAGIEVAVEMQDNTVSRITLTDTAGNYVEFHRASYDGVKAYVPAPPKMKKACRVTGKVVGVAISEDYESEYTAKRRLSALQDAGSDNAKIETVEVPDDTDLLEEAPIF